jgi:hypothetical protein
VSRADGLRLWWALVLLLAGAAPALPGARSSESSPVLPWTDPQAEKRQVFLVAPTLPLSHPVVELSCAALGEAPLRVVRAQQPAQTLPIFRARNGTVFVKLPTVLDPSRPELLLVYSSQAAGWTPSPLLSQRPEPDDYAQTTYGDAWDFDEGDQEGIQTWGNGPQHYGKIEVRDGKLIIPVTGTDPYFIWGVMFGPPDNRRLEHINSAYYRYLCLRVRQDRPAAQWSVYVTDTAGRYQGYHFWVKGTQWQEIVVDLAEVFAGFWDGREFRALRLDPTNDAPGTTVEIDWVRLLGPTLAGRPGPVLSRAQVEAREKVTQVRAALPARAEAGQRALIHLAVRDARGQAVGGAPLCVGQRAAQALVAAWPTTTGPDGRAAVQVPVGTQAGRREWVVGLCDDLGHPAPPLSTAPLLVTPGPLHHYRLSTERDLLPVTRPRVVIEVWGEDRFHNPVPVDLAQPRWEATGGARVPSGPLRGAPARVEVLCAPRPLTRHLIRLWDAAGRQGQLELRTMAYKQHPFTLTPTGYLLDAQGRLFLPLGGFYANWPCDLPAPDGSLKRALDLFPCGPTPYSYGFPWPPEVEREVQDFLQLCHRHGVTALRLMLRNMDLVGRVDEVQLQAVLHLFDLARPLGIYFDLVLFEDYDKPPYVNRQVLERVVLPRYTATELAQLPAHRARFLVEKRLLPVAAQKYTDPDVLACQKDFLHELLPHLAARDEIFCYELENEMVAPPLSWVNEITAFLRRLDPHTLVLGNPGPHEWPEPWRWRAASVDLFSYHPYSDGLADADHGAVAYLCSKWAAASGKARFAGEGGINQNRWQQGVRKVAPPYAARGIRDQIWLSLCCGDCGAFMWAPEHELEMAEFGKVAPALQALGLALERLQRRRPTTALLMPQESAANRQAYALAWRLLAQGIDFDVLPAQAAGGYPQCVDPTQASSGELPATPELFRPGPGYQLAYLAAQDLSQVLIYLRNVAGGVVNLGDGRACYLRQPRPAIPSIRLVGPAPWHHVSAFDLDSNQPAPVHWAHGAIELGAASEHDYVLGLRK